MYNVEMIPIVNRKGHEVSLFLNVLHLFTLRFFRSSQLSVLPCMQGIADEKLKAESGGVYMLHYLNCDNDI